MSYKVSLEPSGIIFLSSECILDDALAQSIPLDHSCKTGDCGVCEAEVISGDVDSGNGEVVTQGSVLTCQSKVLSDVVLRANYSPELIDIKKQTVPCKVSSIDYAIDDIIIIKLRLPPTVKFDYLPGQYIDLSFKGIKRSYSIANAKSGVKELELHIRKVKNGRMSDLIFGQVKENQLMRIEGPKGTFFVRDNNKPLILIATGTGIAPIKAIVEQLVQSGDKRKIYIYWGMQFESELYCQQIEEYANQNEHIKFSPVLSRDEGWQGHKGYVQHAVNQDFNSLEDVEVYACGSIKMIDEAKKQFFDKKLPPDAFHYDAFTPTK